MNLKADQMHANIDVARMTNSRSKIETFTNLLKSHYLMYSQLDGHPDVQAKIIEDINIVKKKLEKEMNNLATELIPILKL